MNKSTSPSQLALKKGEPSPAVLTAKDDSRELAPPEAAQSDVIAGATIRLGVISEQLKSLAASIEIIANKTPARITLDDVGNCIDGAVPQGNQFRIPCPVQRPTESAHKSLRATVSENEAGKFEFQCESGCGEPEIVADNPELQKLFTLKAIGEELGALTGALNLTRSLVNDLRQSLGDCAAEGAPEAITHE